MNAIPESVQSMWEVSIERMDDCVQAGYFAASKAEMKHAPEKFGAGTV